MSIEEFIDGLSIEARESVRGLLRQAYDRGFREALASAGQPAPPPTPPLFSAPSTVATTTLAASEDQPDPAAASGDGGPPPSGVSWDEGDNAPESDDEGDEPAEADAHPVRPILSNATVGTLRKRIIRTFDLERFDIEVIVCRRGDRDRRQLKTSTRLGAFRREEG